MHREFENAPPHERAEILRIAEVYDATYDEVQEEFLQRLREDARYRPLMELRAHRAASETEAEDRQARDVLRQALVDEDWAPYLAHLKEQGVAYAHVGLDYHGWCGAIGHWRQVFLPRLLTHAEAAGASLVTTSLVFGSFIDIVLSTIGMAFLESKEAIIRKQQEEIAELSTPVLRIRDGLLAVPLVGVLDSLRARSMAEGLLSGIRAHRAAAVVIDVTGVQVVDTAVAAHLVDTVRAVRLLGARSVVTGISPEVAMTLVQLGADLRELNTAGDLQAGIEWAEQRLRGLADKATP